MSIEIPIAERFKRLRELNGRKLTQVALARALGISRKAVNAIERGRVRRPKYITIDRLEALETGYEEADKITVQMRDYEGWLAAYHKRLHPD